MSRRCPRCNHVNPDEALRCLACRAPLAQACPRCGAANSLGARKCVACGESFASDTEQFAQLFQEDSTRSIRGRYVIESTLSRGRVDALHRVRDASSGNGTLLAKEISEIALLSGEEKRRARDAFQSEVSRWAAMRHPALPPIVDSFFSREKHYVLMELPQAFSLDQLIRSPSFPMDEDRVANWGAQMCELLTYLHGMSPPYLLGEIRPEHIMLTTGGLVQLVEYKLAQYFLPETDADARIQSRSPYVAPEARGGMFGPEADIYSLGMLLYAAIARRLLGPTSHRPAALRDGIPGASRRFQSAILRATRRSPEERFSSAAEMREMLWAEEHIVLQPLPVRRKRSAQPSATSKTTRPTRASAASPRRSVAPVAAAETPRLMVRPRLLEVQLNSMDQNQDATLAIYNVGELEADMRIVSQVSWVAVSRTTARLGPKQAIKIPITVQGKRLPRGGAADPQAILVDSDAGRSWVAVQAVVSMEPILALAQERIDFGEVQGPKLATGHVQISNAGGGLLSGKVSSNVDWLQVPHPEFHASPGQQAKVVVLLDPRRLAPGVRLEEGGLAVDSDAEQARIAVRVQRVKPVLAVAPDALDFGAIMAGEQVERALTVANEGDGQLGFALQSLVPWLQMSPKPATCYAGQRREMVIVADTARLPEGVTNASQALRVQSNSGVIHVAARIKVLAPKLSVAQERLDFAGVAPGEAAEALVSIRNVGSAPLHCRVTSHLDWLAPGLDEIDLDAQEKADIPVRADLSRFTRGQVVDIPNALHIESNGGEQALGLHMLVLKPSLEVSPTTLDFGVAERAIPVEQHFTIRNADTGVLEWRISTDAQWVEVIPMSGSCAAGQEAEVRITAYGLALLPEQSSATGTLRLRSNGGAAVMPISINLASPHLEVDVTRLNLGTSLNYGELEGTFMVFNHGLGPLRGQITVRSDRLVVEPAEFVCDTGTSQMITVRASTAELPAGLLEERGAILVESNGGQEELDVLLDVILRPELVANLAPLQLSEEGDVARGRLVLENAGGLVAAVSIVPSSPRLSITRRSSIVKPGKTLRLQVTLDMSATDGEEPSLEVSSGDQRLRLPVQVSRD